LRARFVAIAVTSAMAAMQERGRFALAVPGGSVVPTLLSALAPSTLPWGATDVFWCDERAVPPTDERSNYHESASSWLGVLQDSGVRVHRMEADAVALDQSATRYAARLEAALGTPPVLDLAVVGVGEDGHVGSLFPGDPVVELHDRWVVAVPQAPKPPSARLSLTLPVLTAARCLVVAAFGASKRDAMRRALEERDCQLPVARALRASPRAIVLLDDGAASALTVRHGPSGT
jgi:6-phosphogluconolactonase